MEKSIFTDEYEVLLNLLRETRQAAKFTQVQLAERLGQSQSFVSKVEIGERRLDLIQLRTICRHLGTTLPEFVSKLEEGLATREKRRPRR
jgi:transcriptional regulator with XRE-family HTH domain